MESSERATPSCSYRNRARSWKRYFRTSGSNRVPLRPKRADKHSIGFNPVGRINLAVPGAGSESFSSETTATARLRNRNGAHGSLNDTAPIFTRPDSRPTTAKFDRTGFKFVGGSATRSLPNFFLSFSPFSLPPTPDAKILWTDVKMIDSSTENFVLVRNSGNSSSRRRRRRLVSKREILFKILCNPWCQASP